MNLFGEQLDEKVSAETTAEVIGLIEASAPVIFCISGGKDSRLAAEVATEELDRRGHTGPRILMHADVGKRMVWTGAEEECQKLGARLGLRLEIAKREAGDLLDRWLVRWANNVARYAALECVELILPFSTPGMRFCTSELKTAVMCRKSKQLFPKQPVMQVLGIRRDEGRSKKSGRGIAPVSKLIVQQKGKTPPLTPGSVIWHPIVSVKTPAVFSILRASDMPLPDAYEVFGVSRYSCVFCIMSSQDDLRNALKDKRNHDIYREQCELEIVSTFSFQGGRWLSDVRPDLLTEHQRGRLALAKEAARLREQAEAMIPKHLLFEKGKPWPKAMPTPAEADVIAGVRRAVAEACGLVVDYTDGAEVYARFAELIEKRDARRGAAATPEAVDDEEEQLSICF